VPSLQKERPIALRLATECVSGRITDRIGFGLDDTPAQPASHGVMHHHPANQVARQFHGIDWQLRSPQTPQPSVGSRWG
jgi:hypothetical protein